jgi:MFS family permease
VTKYRAEKRRITLHWAWIHLRQRAAWFTAGGRWTDRLRPTPRRNLRWFWFDGVFASASDSIVITYLSLFILELGGTRAQIGLMSSLSSLSAALLLLPGAAIVERWGRRKQIVVLSGGVGARVALLLLALLPLAFGGPAAVYIAIALTIGRSALANLGMPAWTALTADIVPLKWRGRYFSSRNIVMEIAKMSTTALVGLLIARAGVPVGYQLAMGLAFVVGMVSTFSFARLDDAEPGPRALAAPQAATRPLQANTIQQLRAYPEFVFFCAVTALWNFSINVAGPFFSIYLVEGLQASPDVVGALSVIAPLTALPAQRLFGFLVDRWGPHRVQLVTGLLIPLLPMAWALTRSPWHVVPIHLLGGFLWAGYGLGNFNFLLALTPGEQRARYSAIYQIVVMAGLAVGAAFGGVIAEHWGYTATFVSSGVGRLIAALMFARFVRLPNTR